MSLDADNRETTFWKAGRPTVSPLSYGPYQARLINGEKSVQRGLSYITDHIFAGTGYEGLNLLDSAYAFIDDGQGNITLHGCHKFYGLHNVNTRHTVHAVDVRLVARANGESVVEPDASSDIRYVFESEKPSLYGTVMVLNDRLADVVDDLLVAAQGDAFMRAQADSN
jgi:hypothetical protein